LNLLRGFNPQAALDAPRFCISPPPHLITDTDALEAQEVQEPNPTKTDSPNCEVYFEDGIPAETVQTLRRMGHDTSTLTGYARGMFGRGQIIQRFSQGQGFVWAAGGFKLEYLFLVKSNSIYQLRL
jgi:gamma-glutamyltranspeptidase/glutathione hydrolase